MAGWDELEAMANNEGKPHNSNDDTNRLVLRVFGTDEGQKLLGLLREQFLEQPVAVPGSTSDFAFYREGQNSIIRDIEARIKRARNI